MKWALTALVVLAILLHQDFWLWGNRSLVFGFVPIGLAYHTLYSVAAALVMWTLVRYAWPSELEHADASEASGGAQ